MKKGSENIRVNTSVKAARQNSISASAFSIFYLFKKDWTKPSELLIGSDRGAIKNKVEFHRKRDRRK